MRPLPTNFFSEIITIDPSELADLQATRLEIMSRRGWNPNLGSHCRTSSGRSYLYGPAFSDRTNAWQNFIMGTRGKRFGHVYHYSHIDDPSSSAWTHYSDRYRVRCPLDEATARRLAKIINKTNTERALVFSGSLLADLLLWADRAHISLSRDVIFTTFELFPPSLVPRLLQSFGDWCDYMRSWDGGLTYWRCREGRYHTLDNATIMRVDSQGQAIVTDLTNYAEKFVEYETGDLVSRATGGTRCACGAPDFGFRHLGSKGWTFQTKDRQWKPIVPHAAALPPGIQIYQCEPGEVVLLKPEPWIDDDLKAPSIQAITSDPSWSNVTMQRGYYRRGDKKPPVFCTLSTKRKKVLLRGFSWPIEVTMESV